MQPLPAATSGLSVLEVLRELTRVLESGLSATELAANDDSVEEARRIELCQIRRCIRALIAESCCLELEAIGARCEQPQLLDRIEHLCAGARVRPLLSAQQLIIGAAASQAVLVRARDCARCASPPLALPAVCVSSLLAAMPEQHLPVMPVTYRTVASAQSTGGMAMAIAAVSHAHANAVFEPVEAPQRTTSPPPTPPAKRERLDPTPRGTAVARPSSIVVQRAISIDESDVAGMPSAAPALASALADDGDALTLGVGVGLGVQLRGQQVGARHIDERTTDFQARQVAQRPPPEQFADRVSVGNPVKVDGGPLGSYTVYTCTVERRTGPNIVVQRRYSDFVRLRERLMQLHSQSPSAQLAGVPELPEKRLVGRFNAAFVEKRRQGLEEMLTYIVKNRELGNNHLTRQFFLN